MIIRAEKQSDKEEIYAVTEAAFRGRPYAGGDEQDVVDRLRDKGALTISLVALVDDALVGHIAFSPAHAADNSGPWLALGPVSVLPAHQGNGIGSELILTGLTQAQKSGALGCILTGNPDFYRRFGFELQPENAPEGEPAQYFMLKKFANITPLGALHFNSAFGSSINKVDTACVHAAILSHSIGVL